MHETTYSVTYGINHKFGDKTYLITNSYSHAVVAAISDIINKIDEVEKTINAAKDKCKICYKKNKITIGNDIWKVNIGFPLCKYRLSQLTERGTWSTSAYCPWNIDNLCESKKPKQVSEEKFEPLEFKTKPDIEYHEDVSPTRLRPAYCAVNASQFNQCQYQGIVTIENGKVSSEIMKPNADVFYQIHCQYVDYKYMNILYKDGWYYPLSSTNPNYLTIKEIEKYKSMVFSETDKALIETLIKERR